ncbi:MAG: anthranilate synthase component I [Anaerolineae bacterium]|nr:anthranilate synthase component I [Anaerolineae bacterium]MDW8100478.1 anthranilate synthase component I [Anaerolineae bacterium]
MYHPTLDEFKRLAEHGNLVPVYQELPADLETPVSVYIKLRNGGPSFLLESVEKGEQLGRYSFIGVQPPLMMLSKRDRVWLTSGAGAILEEKLGTDPFTELQRLLERRCPVGARQHFALPRFTGGAVGYWGYDTVRFIERLPETAVDDRPDLPDAAFLLADNLVVFDHVRHRLLVIANARLEGDLTAAYAEAVARIESVVSQLRQPLQIAPPPKVSSDARWESNVTQAEYEAMVRRAKEYIAAGDIFQVVLSQRLRRRTQADPLTIYRALRMLNPSPYMFLLEMPGDVRLIGSSPEMHVRLEGRIATLHPIAGTRWRGATPEEDARLAEELLADPKERAEHVMLVDLGRNDLGRVCEYGTVRVPTMMAIERYSHVMHIVSDVQGVIRPGMNAFDLLKATFPAGTVSGAPKVRAMEIIEELEGIRRGPYAGAVGYVDYDGTMDTCIAIRTIVMRGDLCDIQAGGGIVADSDPTYEFNESMNKARALALAVEQAERGLV